MDDRASGEALESIKLEILQGQLDEKCTQALSYLTAATSEFKFPSLMQSLTEKRNTLESFLQLHGGIEGAVAAVAQVLQVTEDETKESAEQKFWDKFSVDSSEELLAVLQKGKLKAAQKAFALQRVLQERNLDLYKSVFLTKKDEPFAKFFDGIPAAYWGDNTVDYVHAETERVLQLLEHFRAIDLFCATRAVLLIAETLLSRYRAYKRQHSKMDYNDLIMLAKQLLESPKVAEWVLFKLDGGIDSVLIDEAQDTSPEQWAIVKALTNEFFSGEGAHATTPTVFVVGDRKQSIYSFQGADPRVFEQMHQYFAKQSSDFRDVMMDVSFRSTSAVLDMVNKVFALEKGCSGVAQPGQNLSHMSSRIGDGGKVEMWPVITKDAKKDSDAVWLPPVERVVEVSPAVRLAQQIASYIKEKVSKGEMLESKGRPIKYSDFLILVQRRNAFVEAVVRACKTLGVAISGVDKIKLSEQIAVQDLLALAKFALLPDDDLNLACVLKSPLFGLDDDDLFKLCYNRAPKSVWARLKENPGYQATADVLQKIYRLAAEVRPFEFFAYVMSELQGRKKFVARLGFDCTDALDEFCNLTLAFEREHIPSLQLFVEWMQKDDVEVKRNLEQKDVDAVRLMTVHASKGLQAPIVILPDMVRLRSTKEDIGLLGDEQMILYPLGKEYYEENCKHIKQQETQHDLDEYHRLLYVALTRAEDRLCLCGYSSRKANEKCWYEICREALEKIGIKDDKDIVAYTTEQQLAPDTSKNKGKQQGSQAELPRWTMTKPQAQGLLSKPLTPSHQDESKIAAVSPLMQNRDKTLYARGLLIHKLLQFLPNVALPERHSVCRQFLETQATDYSAEDRELIQNEVMNLISNAEFAPLFSAQSRSEVALMGQVDDCIISGQIDRLVVEADRVMIVDYKTNRPAAKALKDVPVAYLKQMAAYRELIKKIYPDKKVESYILWTNTAQIMKIE